MNFLNHYAIAPLLTSFTTFLLAAFVYLKNRKIKTNRIFALYYLSITVWSFCQGLLFCTQNPEDKVMALLWARLLHCGVFFIPTLFVHFILIFLNEIKQRKNIVILAYLISFFLLIICPTRLFIKDMVPKFSFRYIVEPGGLYLPSLLFFLAYVTYGLYKLFKAYYAFSGIKANQTKYLLWGSLFGYMGGSLNFLWVFNIRLYPLNPFGIYTVPLNVFVVAYAIVKHRLMDITFVIRDITLRLVSSVIPAVVFLAVGIVFFSLPMTIIVVILTAIASPLLYRPLRTLLQPVILGGKYDYQRLLKESTKSLVTMLDLSQLLNYMVNTISEIVGVEKISLFLKQPGKSRYEIKASCGLDEELVDNYVLKPNEGIIPWLKQSKAVFIKGEMERALPGKAFKNIYGDLGKIGAESILPLFYKDNLVGVLNLSNKQSGGIYNQTDIDILESLGAETAVAIENARLHTEVITDEVTDLYQPKYFELRLREDLEKAKRYKHCLTLMMVEVDNFEEFKKSHGVEEGDKLLKNIAGIVGENLRMGDIACRCGEKEFGIILPEITEEPWGNLGERLKKQIRETVEIGERLRRRVGEEELGVAVSIGMASFDGQNREMKKETLIKQAKEALSQATRERNTVKVFYDEKLRKEISTEVLEWIKETEETLVSGDIYVDLAKRTVRVRGELVKLTPKAFDLLCLLMKKKERVLNRSFLTESIWGYEYFGTTRTVDSHIKSLRQKLGAEGKKIETIKGIGYRFVEEATVI